MGVDVCLVGLSLQSLENRLYEINAMNGNCEYKHSIDVPGICPLDLHMMQLFQKDHKQF